MSRKSKKQNPVEADVAEYERAAEAAYPEETLENPAGTATETAASAIDWPESTETRQLDVKLTPEEVNTEALRLVETMDTVDRLTAEKKTSAKAFDIQIEAAEEEITLLKTVVTTKQARREVECFWTFEVNGLDKDGNPITHTGMKTLFRRDTCAVVEVLPISGEDRQMVLPLDDAESLKLNLAKLKEIGWEVMETPDDIEHDKPFQGVSADAGRTIPITADSLADAARDLLKALVAEFDIESHIAPAA